MLGKFRGPDSFEPDRDGAGEGIRTLDIQLGKLQRPRCNPLLRQDLQKHEIPLGGLLGGLMRARPRDWPNIV